ncbi:MAG TPA: hypothetical protein VF168_05585 [Trueperaceae bacterium]
MTRLRGSRSKAQVALVVVAVAMSGCGGQGGPPRISSIGTQRTTLGEPLSVPFTVVDEDPSTVAVSATADEANLVPPSGLVISGAGPQRSLLVAPAAGATGSTNVTVRASDGTGTEASESFALAIEMPFAGDHLVIPADNRSNTFFGGAVAAHGDEVLVAAVGEDDASGAAYLYRRDGSDWRLSSRLEASDAAPQEGFGWSVAFDGDHGVVGAIADAQKGTSAGAVYVFERDGEGWRQSAKLTASDGEQFMFFGAAVDVSGNYLVVGAPGHTGSTGDAGRGAAYLFELIAGEWSEVPIVPALDPAVGDEFGHSVAIDGDRLVVGARGDDTAGANAGAVHVFERIGTEWVATASLLAPDAVDDDGFGASVALEGDRLVVGSPGWDDAATSEGAAYVFSNDGDEWLMVGKMTASVPLEMNVFGYSVDVSGRYVAVGAPGIDPAPVPVPGAAYLFMETEGAWSQVARLTPSDSSPDERFGYHLSLTREYVAVGMPLAEAEGLITGAVHVIER